MDQKWGVTSLPEIAAAMFPKPAVCISQVCHWFATPKSLSNSKCTGPEIVRGYNTSFTLKGFTILTKNQSRNFCNTLSKIKFLKVFFLVLFCLWHKQIFTLMLFLLSQTFFKILALKQDCFKVNCFKVLKSTNNLKNDIIDPVKKKT